MSNTLSTLDPIILKQFSFFSTIIGRLSFLLFCFDIAFYLIKTFFIKLLSNDGINLDASKIIFFKLIKEELSFKDFFLLKNRF